MAIPQGILIIRSNIPGYELCDEELEQIRQQIVRNIEVGALPMVLQTNSNYDFEYLSLVDPEPKEIEPDEVPTKKPRKARTSKKPVPMTDEVLDEVLP